MNGHIAIFCLSLLVLIISANLLLKFIKKFAGRIKISPLIIGATIIAVGTSLPETFVAISSITQKASDISLGDVIGSNIANISLILGLGIFLFPVRVGTEKTQRNNLIMLTVTAVFSALFFVPPLFKKTLGIILLVFYIVFVIMESIWGERGREHEDKKALAKFANDRGNPFLYLLGITASLTGLVASSHYLVESVIYFSKLLKISEEIIGLSVVAFGTSLPELATTIASGFNKDWKLLYGDIQGSNIYNLAVIGAILFIANGIGLSASLYSLMILWVVTLGIIYLSKRFEGTNIPHIYGLLFLAIYSFYIFKLYHI